MAVSYVQQQYRFRSDAAATNTAGTFPVALNTAWRRGNPAPFRLRFTIQSTGSSGTAAASTQNIRVAKNGSATYNPVGAGTGFASVDATGGLSADNAAITSAQLGAGTGTWLNGQYDSDGATGSFTITRGYYTEVEFGLQITLSEVAQGDYFDFRVYRGSSAQSTYTVTPRLTILKIAGDVVTFSLSEGATPTNFAISMPADVAPFALTGIDAGLTYTPAAKSIAAEVGAYTLNISDQVTKDYSLWNHEVGTYSLTVLDAVKRVGMPADAGAYSLNGPATLFPTSRVAASGAYTLTLQQGFPVLYIKAGSYSLNGIDAGLSKQEAQKIISAEVGAYTLAAPETYRSLKRVAAGTAYTLTGIAEANSLKRTAALGTFTLTGRVTYFPTKRVAALGTYTLTINDAVKRVTMPAVAGSYTLTGNPSLWKLKRTALVGAYTLTGNAMRPVMLARVGSYSVGGVAVNLRRFRLPAEAGALALNGVAAGLSKTGASLISADAGAITLGGVPALFPTKRTAAVGAHALTINPAVLRVTMPAAAGAYALTGVAMTPAVKMPAVAGALVLSGLGANWRLSRTAATGTFQLTGVPVTMTKAGAYAIVCATAPFALNGLAAPAHRKMVAASGSYFTTGVPVSFAWKRAYSLPAATGAYALTGLNVNLARVSAWSLSCFTGTYSTQVSDIVVRDFAIRNAKGTFAVAGGTAGGIAARKLQLATGAFALNGVEAGVRAGRHIRPDIDAIVLTGNAVGALNEHRIVAAPASYAVDGKEILLRAAPYIVAAGGSYSLTGNAETNTVLHRIAAGSANYVWRISDIVTTSNRFYINPLSYSVTINPVGTKRLRCEVGSIALNGVAASVFKLTHRAWTMQASVGAYDLGVASSYIDGVLEAATGGYAADGTVARPYPSRGYLSAVAGSYALQGSNVYVPDRQRIGTAAVGAFTYTGQAAGLAKIKRIACETVPFDVVGLWANIGKVPPFYCGTGVYLYAGANGTCDFGMNGEAGAFALDGIPAAVGEPQKIIRASTGNYGYAGAIWTDLVHARLKTLIAARGTYALTITYDLATIGGIFLHDGAYSLAGGEAVLIKSAKAYPMTAEAGAYQVNGLAVHRDLAMPAEAGALALNAPAATLRSGHRLFAATGAYARGAATTLLQRARFLTASAGGFALNGVPIRTVYGRRWGAETGSYAVTITGLGHVLNKMLTAGRGDIRVGTPTTFVRANRRMAAAGGHDLVSGGSIKFAYSVRLAVGSIRINGNQVYRSAKRMLQPGFNAFALTGNPVEMRVAHRIAAAGGRIAVGGRPVVRTFARRLAAASGSYVQNGRTAQPSYGRRLRLERGTYSATICPVTYKRSVRAMPAEGARYKVEGEHAQMKIGAIAEIARFRGSGRSTKHIHGRGPGATIKGRPGTRGSTEGNP